MSGFTLLWAKILRSSLWVEGSKETRLVWITLLALKDSQGIIQSSVVGLADAAKVSLAECREALAVLLAPDANDTSKVEEGRRIREVAGGWQIVNHDLYRFSTEARREFWRQQKAEQRAAEGGNETKKGRRKRAEKPMSGEALNERRVNRGEPELDPNDFRNDPEPLAVEENGDYSELVEGES